jgi:hypothetical protein
MVSPLLAVVGPAVQPLPLIEIAVQPAPQVTVWPVRPPVSVTVLLVIVELRATLGWSVKVMGLMAGTLVVLIVQVCDCVAPTKTV